MIDPPPDSLRVRPIHPPNPPVIVQCSHYAHDTGRDGSEAYKVAHYAGGNPLNKALDWRIPITGRRLFFESGESGSNIEMYIFLLRRIDAGQYLVATALVEEFRILCGTISSSIYVLSNAVK